jgi:hypothetical protein
MHATMKPLPLQAQDRSQHYTNRTAEKLFEERLFAVQ